MKTALDRLRRAYSEWDYAHNAIREELADQRATEKAKAACDLLITLGVFVSGGICGWFLRAWWAS